MDITKLDKTCRITFSNGFQRELFSTILQNQKITLKELAHVLNVSRWTLKRWRSGTYSVSGESFAKLYSLFSEVRLFVKKHHLEIKSASWGARQGGLTLARKYSREELRKRMSHIRSFIKIKPGNPQARIPAFTADFWEFYGTMLGDGCLSKYFIKSERRIRYNVLITGGSIGDIGYFEQHLKPQIKRLFDLNPSIIHDRNVIRLNMQSKVVFNFLNSIGYPVGKKTDLHLHEQVMSLPWDYKKMVIRGLLDTDGCFFARKDENYRYPYVLISSAHSDFRKQIVSSLRERGYPAYIHGMNVLVRGAANLHKWMSDIGSSHPKNIKRYNDWIKIGRMFPLRGP